MLTRLLLIAVAGFSLVAFGNDKDNGFPFATASGTWVSSDDGIIVSLRTRRVQRQNAYSVKMSLYYEGSGDPIAQGEGVSRENQSQVVLPMKDIDGNLFYVVMRHVRNRSQKSVDFPEDYRLEIKFFKTKKSSRSFMNIVLNRWREIKH